MMDKEIKTETMDTRFRRAIRRTFQTIGYDAFGEGNPSLAIMVEVTLDADYMEMYGGDKEATIAFRKLTMTEQDKIAEKALS